MNTKLNRNILQSTLREDTVHPAIQGISKSNSIPETPDNIKIFPRFNSESAVSNIPSNQQEDRAQMTNKHKNMNSNNTHHE